VLIAKVKKQAVFRVQNGETHLEALWEHALVVCKACRAYNFGHLCGSKIPGGALGGCLGGVLQGVCPRNVNRVAQRRGRGHQQPRLKLRLRGGWDNACVCMIVSVCVTLACV